MSEQARLFDPPPATVDLTPRQRFVYDELLAYTVQGDGLPCTHCDGEGLCWDGCDPLWYDAIHKCHACHGSGRRRDQVLF